MAVPADRTGIVLLQVSMECRWVLQLGCYVRVAGYTFVSHSGSLPESGVAGGALVAKTGMRGYSAQWCTCLSVKRAWTEKYAAAHKAHHHNSQNGQQGRYQAGNRQAAEWLLFHGSALS